MNSIDYFFVLNQISNKTTSAKPQQTEPLVIEETPLLTKLAIISFILAKISGLAAGVCIFAAHNIAGWMFMPYGGFLLLSMSLAIYQMYFVYE